MANQDLDKYYSELISKYLSGNTSTAEVQELEAWVLADPEHKKQFIAFKKAWTLSGIQENKTTVDVDKFWAETAAQLFEEEQAIPKVIALKPKRRPWVAIAASIAILLVLSIWFLLPASEQSLMASTTTESQSVQLPDGSTVILNRASSIRYNLNEETQTRAVTLTGDAFFEVAKNASKPFIISTGPVEVQVLGTAFYVDARAQEAEIQVIVESGTVEVRADTQKDTLKANDKAVFNKATAELKEVKNEDSNFNALKTKTLVFENNTLEEVLFVLSRQYNVSLINTIEDSSECLLNGTFKDKRLEDILDYLKETFRINYTINGDRVTLSGSSCQ